MIYRKIWNLLGPFHRYLNRYMLGIVLRQGLLVLGGYSLVWALRLCVQSRGIPSWLFVAGLILFDAGFFGYDNRLNLFYASRVSFPLFGHLRNTSLGKVFEMPLEWHQRKNSGTLVGEVNNGVGKVVQTAEGVSRELVPAVVQTGFSLVPLLLFTPLTTPPILLALGLFLWLTVLENRKRQPYRKSRYDNYARDFGIFAESVKAVRPVVQFGQSGRLLRRYDRVQQRIIREGVEETHIGTRYGFRRNMILSVAKRVCQGIWIWEFRRGTMDPAMVMYANMLTEQLLTSFWGYAGLLERIYEGLEPTKILVKLLEETPRIAERAGAEAVSVPPQVDVQMMDVRFAYQGRGEVIRQLNLSIPEGRILGIVGRSGCGKTTIHSLLSRMFDIQDGQILIAGRDIRYWPLEQLRGLFSYVSQDAGIFFSGFSLLDTIRFTRPNATFREVVHAARCACIHDDIVRMPRKYKTRVGEGGLTLSKGQQQRIALAQALLALGDDRKILILDEFTSALDSETEQRILDNIFPYLAGRTVIIIAHRLATVRKVADQVVVLDAGRIVEQGTPEELVQQGGWYAETARLQAVAPDELPETRGLVYG